MTGKILLLSDLHVGSKWGLWPPKFSAESARSGEIEQYPQNAAGKAIWAHWLLMLKALKKDKPDCIILNGDLVEGIQRREYGRGLITPEINIQEQACIKVLKTLPKVPMYFTQGTDYHENLDGIPIERSIAEKMGGTFGDELIVEECGIRLFCRHAIGISSSTWQYLTTAPARDHLLLYLNKSPEKYGPIDVCVFSHRHSFTAAQFLSGIALVTPCWQGKTIYAVKKGIIPTPDIGWVMLHIDAPRRIMIDTTGVASVVRPCKVAGRGK